MTLVLLVDDVPAMAEQYAYDLQRMGGYETAVAGGGREALETLGRDAVDCVILDLEMPGVDGFEVLKEMSAKGLDVPVIVYTGTGDYERCARAIRLGAYSFIDKAEPMERVVREVENAIAQGRLVEEVRALREQLGEVGGLVGDGAAMRELRAQIERVAPVPSPAIILGESGSGKELVARELHRLGPAPDARFVAINCAALPENLVESELFGHERGAFTGAVKTHRGAFEAAGRGTLFLDEIGELPAAAQAKLLRALEERQVTRVGGDRAIVTEARVLAATNRDLEADAAEGRFRQDLFFRINVHTLRVPPLRDRLEDVPTLAEHMMVRTAARYGLRPKRIGPAALAELGAYDWRKNNVRELRNVVERMLINSRGDTITALDLPADIIGGGYELPDRPAATFQELKAEAERRIVLAALARNEGHVTRTAEDLGLADHSSLLKIMRRHGIKAKS